MTHDPTRESPHVWFLRETLANTAMFICIAMVAFLVDWFVAWLEGMGIKPIIGMTLEGVAYMLFAVDVVVFTVMQGRLVYRA